MATPEVPRRIENQADLYKKSKEEFDWKALQNGTVKIKEGPGARKEGTTDFDRALRKILTPANFNTLTGSVREQARLTVSKQIAAIDFAAVHTGFDMSLAKTGDQIALENGVLYIDLQQGTKQLFLKLDPKAASIRPGYVELKPEAVTKSRRAWKSLQEGFKHGILSEILRALGEGERNVASFENRTRIWEDKMNKTEAYKGTAKQNKEMVDYLKNETDAGRTVDVAPPPAPTKVSPKGKLPASPYAPEKATRKAEGFTPTGVPDTGYTKGRETGRWPETRTENQIVVEALRENVMPEEKDELDTALSKMSDFNQKASALDAKITQLETLQTTADRNRSLKGVNKDTLIGSLRTVKEKAMEIEMESNNLLQEVIPVRRFLKQFPEGKNLNSADKQKITEAVAQLEDTETSLTEIFDAAESVWGWAHTLLNPREKNKNAEDEARTPGAPSGFDGFGDA